jgi:hypothetical protein
MKRVEIFLYSLYAIGIGFKLFKLPMHTVFILATLLVIIIYYVICLLRKTKNRFSILTGLVTVVWLFSLLAILKHFPFQNISLIVALVLSAMLLIAGSKNKKLLSANNLFHVAVIGITVLFRLLPAHSTYYLTNIKFNHEIDIDYFSWDKYSWFLYNDGKQNEAIQANKNAQIAAEKCLLHPKYGDEKKYLNLIKRHNLEIKNKTWKQYP